MENDLFAISEKLYAVLDEDGLSPAVGSAALSTALCMIAISVGISAETLCEGMTRTYKVLEESRVEPKEVMQ